MCIIQTKCGAKGGSASLTVNHSCCEGDSCVENIRWQLYSGTEHSSLHDNGVCEQAYDRVCDETGGQRRRRMRAGVRQCVQRNGRSTTTAYASRRTTVCNVTGGRQQRRMRAGVRACVRRIGRSTTTTGSNDGCRLIAE